MKGCLNRAAFFVDITLCQTFDSCKTADKYVGTK